MKNIFSAFARNRAPRPGFSQRVSQRFPHGLLRQQVAPVMAAALLCGMVAPLSVSLSAPPVAHAESAKPSGETPDGSGSNSHKNIWDPDADLRVDIHSRESNLPLRSDDSPSGYCTRDPLASNFQRCRIWSPANHTYISIHYKPAMKRSKRVLLLLDGASAVDSHNRWINGGGAARTMADTDINVILPIGGGSSYYADFQYRYRHCSLIHPQLDRQQWETFITKELVAWAGSNGMDTTGWSVGGFSMGGGSALSLTERHPDLFDQVLSYSGMDIFVIPGLLELMNSTNDITLCIARPFGSPLNPSRYEFDPFLNMEKLRSAKDVYISNSLGFVLPRNYQRGDLLGNPWEWGVALLNAAFMAKASAIGLTNVTYELTPQGSHSYHTAALALRKTKQRILNKDRA